MIPIYPRNTVQSLRLNSTNFLDSSIRACYRSRFQRICSQLSICSAVGLAITSAYPWFVWGVSFHVFFTLLFVVFRCPLLKRKSKRDISLIIFSYVIYIILFSHFLVDPLDESLKQLLSRGLAPLLIILFNKAEVRLFIRWLINTFAIMALIGIVPFAIKIFFVELPYSEIINPNPYYPPFKNYYFFIVNHDLGYFTRFSGMLTEPGHMGMFSALLLYVSGYSLRKWQNIILTASLIWSFSLAGYVLYFLGFIIYRLCSGKQVIKVLLKISAGVVLLVTAGIAYYSPSNDDMMTIAILSRLEVDDKKGLAGNNRNTSTFNNEYDKFCKSADFLSGIPTKEYDRKFGGTANSSYKVFILTYGFLCFLALLAFLISNNIVYPSKLGFGFTLLILASFIQRPYFMWEIESFTYLCYMPYIYNVMSKKRLQLK